MKLFLVFMFVIFSVLPAMADDLVLIKGGEFTMGSPESEPWRVNDETQHEVSVSDFYISKFEVTQKEFFDVMNNNPSNFEGDDLPVENISWLDAIKFCNRKSELENLVPVYKINGSTVEWDLSADGYRLPTEAEWEYACRAGTKTPFNTESSISAEEANYYGHYPYEIENNYFNQKRLKTKPGRYRGCTVEVNSFNPNKFGLYNMHGNVGEWVWDWYGSYKTSKENNPTGNVNGTLKIYRGGGWNDFAKNMRSSYRAAMKQDGYSFNIGMRLARNASSSSGIVLSSSAAKDINSTNKIIIVYFSWSGTTRGIARQIQKATGADIFEIELEKPYSPDYNTVLNEAQRDQRRQARPEIKNHIKNFESYDVILLGYPNWWASIPMPIATFLENNNFSGKTIIPFCSHGGGRFGQSLTAIAKLLPDIPMGKALSVHYSGGSELENDIRKWLDSNGLK